MCDSNFFLQYTENIQYGGYIPSAAPVLKTMVVWEVNHALEQLQFFCKQSDCSSWAIDGRPSSSKQVSWIPLAPQTDSRWPHAVDLYGYRASGTIIVSVTDTLFAGSHLIHKHLAFLQESVLRIIHTRDSLTLFHAICSQSLDVNYT